MRIVKPSRGGWTRFSKSAIESGDGVWYSFMGTIATAGSIPGAILPSIVTGNPGFMLIAVPAALFLSTVFGYVSGTEKVDGGRAKLYVEANRLLPKITGVLERPIAERLVENIWLHTLDNHYSNCETCTERVTMLKELAPNQIKNREDIEEAKLMLETRREVASWSERKQIG